MSILFGTILLGRVDETSAGQFVATSFFHICFIPIIPLNSYIVTRQRWMNWEGIKIRYYRKSLIIGYLRGTCAVGVFFLILGLVYLLQHRDNSSVTEEDLMGAWAGIIGGSVGLVTMLVSYALPQISKAKPEVRDWIERHVSFS